MGQIEWLDCDEQEIDQLNSQTIQNHLKNIINNNDDKYDKDMLNIKQLYRKNNKKQQLQQLFENQKLKYYQQVEQKSFYTKKYNQFINQFIEDQYLFQQSSGKDKAREKQFNEQIERISEILTQNNLRCQPITFRKVIRNKNFAVFHVTNQHLQNNIMKNNFSQNRIDQGCLYAMHGNLVIVEHMEPFSLNINIPGCGFQATYRSLSKPDKLDKIYGVVEEEHDEQQQNIMEQVYQNQDIQNQQKQFQKLDDRFDLLQFPKLADNCYKQNTFYDDTQNKIVWQANFAFTYCDKTLAFIESPIGFQQFTSYRQQGRYLLVRNRKFKLDESQQEQIVGVQENNQQSDIKYQKIKLQKSQWILRKIQCVFVTGQTIVKKEPPQDKNNKNDYIYYNIILNINRKATSNYISNLMYQYNIYEGFYRTLLLNNNSKGVKSYFCWMQLDRLHGFIHSLYSFYTNAFINQQRPLFYPQQDDKQQSDDKLILFCKQLQSCYVSDQYTLAFSQKPSDPHLQQLYQNLHDPYKKLLLSRYTVNESIKSQNKDSQESLFGLSFDLKAKLDKNWMNYDLPKMPGKYELHNIMDYLVTMNDDICKDRLNDLDIDMDNLKRENKYGLEYEQKDIEKTLQKDENKERLIGYYIYSKQSISHLREVDKDGQIFQKLNFFANFKKKDEVNTSLAYQCVGQHTIKQIVLQANYLYQIDSDDLQIFNKEDNTYHDNYGKSFQYIQCWFNSTRENKKQTRSDHYDIIDINEYRIASYMRRPKRMQEWTQEQIDRIYEQEKLIDPKCENEKQDQRQPQYYKFIQYVPIIDEQNRMTDQYEVQNLEVLEMRSQLFQKAFGGKSKNSILQKIDDIINDLFGDQIWTYYLDNLNVPSLGNYNYSLFEKFYDTEQQQNKNQGKQTFKILKYINQYTDDSPTITIPINSQYINIQSIQNNKQLKYIPINYNFEDIIDKSKQFQQCQQQLEKIAQNPKLRECQYTQLIEFINKFCDQQLSCFQLSIKDHKNLKEDYKYQDLVFLKDLTRPTEKRCDIHDIVSFFEDVYNMISCILARYLRIYGIQTYFQLKQQYKPDQEEQYNPISRTFNKSTPFGQIIELIELINKFIKQNEEYLFFIFAKIYRSQRDQLYDMELKTKASILWSSTLIQVLKQLFGETIIEDTLEHNSDGYTRYTFISLLDISIQLIDKQNEEQQSNSDEQSQN